jgi:hypothetical protein
MEETTLWSQHNKAFLHAIPMHAAAAAAPHQ